MTAILRIALASAWHRRGTLALVALSIALATLLLLGVERVRADVRQNFAQAVSGTDLIVGARTGPLQLLLYAVFRVGGATNNVRLESLEQIARHRAVAWMVPLSLGDSHRGFAVLATTPDYFEHYRHGDRQPLTFAQGRPFGAGLDGLYEVVLGADVADTLGYRLGDRLTLSHGSGEMPGSEHADKPFAVVGILQRTGTPVDRTLHINLQSMEAIHLDWTAGVPLPGARVSAEQARAADLRPQQVTAALVGLKNRAAVFAVQRAVAEFEAEPLLAVLPGVALDELWQVVGAGERALLAVSAMVGVVSLAGLVAVVLAGLNERRRELAVLRAVGAAPRHVLAMLAAEGALVTLAGVVLGVLLTGVAIAVAAPVVQARFGLGLSLGPPDAAQWALLGAVLAAGFGASLVPGWRAYRLSLADGLAPRA
ncbi:MAG: ABC transporter permease [Burkholderiales bacterium]|nr:ABC transporter permease [Burkholderiales bacterium]